MEDCKITNRVKTERVCECHEGKVYTTATGRDQENPSFENEIEIVLTTDCPDNCENI